MIYIGKERALQIASRLYEELIYEISLSEDNKMTLIETASTLSGTIPPNARIKDVILVEGLKNGYQYMLNLVLNNEFYLDKNIMNNINRLVASNDNFDNVGGFRKYGIRVSGTTTYKPVEPEDLDFEYVKIVNKFYDNQNNGEEIINLFLDLIKAQLYGNGNKRTQQLLMLGLLIDKGYTPFTINFKEIDFASALVKFYDDESNRKYIKEKLLLRQNEILKSNLSKKELEKYFTPNTKNLEKKKN